MGTRCPDCHHEIGDEMVFCPHCGREVRASAHRPGYLAPTGPVSVPRHKEDTNILVIVVLVVAILVLLPVFLAMILYVGVLEFGSDQRTTPQALLTAQTVTWGKKFSVVSITTTTSWNDVEIAISEDDVSAVWSPLSTSLAGGATAVASLGQRTLGTLTLWCNVTDLAGNGMIDVGDSFTMTTVGSATFSASTAYTVWLLYEPTSVRMAQVSFVG